MENKTTKTIELTTVDELMKVLEGVPKDACLYVLGAQGYIYIEEINGKFTVSFDDCADIAAELMHALDEEYEDGEES